MASAALAPRASGDDRRFFLNSAIAMVLLVVAGFSLQFATGRSSFAAPPLVHAHAIVFMGWVTIYLLQNLFAASGNLTLHRRLGWLGAGWIVAMLVLGLLVTVAMVRRGQAPFFFRPQNFLIFNPVVLITFFGLTVAAIRLRRRTDWHRRLHYCGMSLLLGPAFGRLLPMPLLQPWTYEAVFAAIMIFPVLGVWHDVRRARTVHPAWKWGMAAVVGTFLLSQALTYSAAGDAIYRFVTAGSPGSQVPGLQFPPPPTAPLVTGRGAPT